jgi:hypothetical protein
MNSLFVSPPNAILFVLDPTNEDVIVPPLADVEIATSSASCVSIGTRADVDGDVEISASLSNFEPNDLKKVFFGRISTPGKKIAIVTSEFEILLELDVITNRAIVSVWVDDHSNPSVIFVGVDGK